MGDDRDTGRGEGRGEGDPGRFRDPLLYDVESPWGLDDEFYLALARRVGGPVLDLGCGTGRLARAIAKAGIPVTAVDPSPEALELARGLSGSLPVEWVQGDSPTIELGRRFRLALMTGHAFQSLLTEGDQNAAFARVYAHLLPRGTFAFELRNPAARSGDAGPGARPWRSYRDLLGRWVDVTVLSRWDEGGRVERLSVTRTRRDTGAVERSRIALRHTDVSDVNLLLLRHGFSVLTQHGDWTEGPLTPESPAVVSVCQAF
jgi:SAM-dependent methyltransferase